MQQHFESAVVARRNRHHAYESTPIALENDRLYISSREDSDRIGESIGPLGASTRDLAGSYRVPWKKVPEYVRTFSRRREGDFLRTMSRHELEGHRS